jgi:hypothetical protein
MTPGIFVIKYLQGAIKKWKQHYFYISCFPSKERELPGRRFRSWVPCEAFPDETLLFGTDYAIRASLSLKQHHRSRTALYLNTTGMLTTLREKRYSPHGHRVQITLESRQKDLPRQSLDVSRKIFGGYFISTNLHCRYQHHQFRAKLVRDVDLIQIVFGNTCKMEVMWKMTCA